MNLQNIFSEIENVDADFQDRMDTRRSAMKEFANFSGKVALAAMPLAIGSMFKKAYGQTPTDVLDVLQFALTLEYLEAEFYTLGVARSGVQNNAGSLGIAALSKIRDHENAHVAYLRSVITALGSTPVAKPNFDFTGGKGIPAVGPFQAWDTNYDVFLAVSQTLEDTGVRAYKGQAGRLINNKAILTAALNIHSVEARHASHVRQMRRARGVATSNTTLYSGSIKPWINQKDSNIGVAPYAAAVQGNYNGEENIVQGGVTITNLPGGASLDAATASFDEPLTKAQVLILVDPFIAP